MQAYTMYIFYICVPYAGNKPVVAALQWRVAVSSGAGCLREEYWKRILREPAQRRRRVCGYGWVPVPVMVRVQCINVRVVKRVRHDGLTGCGRKGRWVWR